MKNDDTACYSHGPNLEEVLATYLEAARTGHPPPRQELLARHPELATELEEFFAGHDLIRDLAEPLRLDAAACVATAASAESGPMPRRFGDYELLEKIARGGMGIVYRARQVSLNRVVALKMIVPGGRPPEEIERFLHTEAKAIASLDHPHIVPVYEVGRCEGSAFYTMKLLGGGSLASVVPSGAGRAAAVLATIARAVHHAHQRGILHRDLKPSNILIDADGQPHVADFGLAKRVEGDSATTRSGEITGTPSYMAPEQASAAPVLTTAVDVWGLGAILYELLTGRPPFRAGTPLDTILQVRGQDPPRPRSLNPTADRDLETICLKCLHKDPARRYGSAEALSDDLERWRRGEPIAARPVTAWERLVKGAKRRPDVSALLGVAAGLLLAVVGVLAWGWQQAADKANAEIDARNAAEGKAAAEKQRAAEAGRRERSVKAHLALEKGSNRLERGEVGPGLLWLVRGLEVAPDDEWGLKDALRRVLGGWMASVPVLQTVFEHDATVTAVAFSPCGKSVAIGQENGIVRVRDVSTGRPVGQPMRHQKKINALAFSPDGTILVTGSEDFTAGLWRAATGERLAELPPYGSPVWTVAVSPDGKTVFTGGGAGTGRFWDVSSGKLTGKLADKTVGDIQAAALLPAGDTFLTAGGEGVRLWEVGTGQLLKTLLPESYTALALAPDGKTFVAAGGGGQDRVTVRRYETATGKPLKETATALPLEDAFPPTKSRVVALAFSPDGQSLLAASADGTVRLWDGRTGAPLGLPWLTRSPLRAAAFSPDGKTVLLGGDHCRLWEVARQDKPERLAGPVRLLAASPDRQTLLGTDDEGQIRLWKLATGEPFGEALGPEDKAYHHYTAVFSPDGKILAMARHLAHRIGLWDTATGKPLGALKYLNDPVTGESLEDRPLDRPGPVNALAFSPDGKVLLAGYGNWAIGNMHCLWDVASRKVVGPAVKHRFSVWVALFSPDGKTFDTGDQRWDTATGKPVSGPLNARDAFLEVRSPDGKMLLTAGRDGTARLWDAATGKPLGEPMRHEHGISAMAFSRDGRTIATGNHDGMVQVWDVVTGKPLGGSLRCASWPLFVEFTPDGGLLCGDETGVFRWRVPSLPETDLERLRAWVEVATGLELDPGGAVIELDAKTWMERRERLRKLGGPP
jgi:WD40 repeat protein